MAFTEVQFNNTASFLNTLSNSCAYTSNVTQGNLLVLYVSWAYPNTSVPAYTVSDTLGNTWSSGVFCGQTANGYGESVFYCLSSKSSGANTVTITGTATSYYSILCCAEYSPGGGNTTVFDTSGIDPQLSGSSYSISLTLAKPNELVVMGVCSNAGSYTFSGGTMLVDLTNLGAGYSTPSSAGAYTVAGNGGGSSSYSVVAIAFYAQANTSTGLFTGSTSYIQQLNFPTSQLQQL